jgi:uncharacterized membrane protein
MKRLRGPAFLLALLYAGFVGFVFVSAGQLPERVATHFNAHGQPNGWMSRSGHILFVFILGTVLPVLIIGLLSFVRSLPAALINVPNRDYWLAPERQGETSAYLLKHGFWFACIIVCFVAGIHYLILQANTQATIKLATPLLLTFSGLFLAALTTWAVMMLRHFRRVPKAAAA